MDRNLRLLATSAMLLSFIVGTWVRFQASPGDDLASGYIACLLLARGDIDAIYAHDSEFFHIVRNPAWETAATESGFTGFLHPYVQPPLWALALTPLCTRLSFPTFQSIFLLLAGLSLAGSLFLAHRYLAELRLFPLVLAATWLWFSLPFNYAMELAQTHAIFLLAAFGALLAAERDRPILAGILLAVAGMIKVTPLLLSLYWLATKRWRALAWLSGMTFALAAVTYAFVGEDLTRASIVELRRISDVLLVSYNNHSVAAWIMAPLHPESIANWRILPLPASIKYLGIAISAFALLLAGTLRRFGASEGAMLSVCLLAMTLSAPIAWTHYYVALAIPIVWMAGRRVLWLPAAAVCALGLIPHGPNRSLLLAGVIACLSCIAFELVRLARSTQLPEERAHEASSP